MNNEWKPIASAPKDGTEILAWRRDCGQFIASYTSPSAFPLTQKELDETDEADLFAQDWFTQWPHACRLEGSEVPTLWQPMPTDPCASCGGHGMVGGLTQHSGYEAEPCPDCTAPASAQDDAKRPLPLGVVLGLGEYIIQHTAPDEPAQIVFSAATQEDRETRTVGDLKESEPGLFEHSRIRGQIQFASVAGLDALEVQLREIRKVHWPDTIVAAPAAGDALELPPLNAALTEILGRPNFACMRLAQFMRLSGMHIAKKSEDEQAAVIHYLLGFYLKHGSQWSEKADEDLEQRRAAIAQQSVRKGEK